MSSAWIRWGVNCSNVLFPSTWWQQYAGRNRGKGKKKKKRKNNVTVRNASESTRKEKPGNIFLWILPLLIVTYSFCFSFASAELDECKVSAATVRRFRLNNTESTRIVRWAKNIHYLAILLLPHIILSLIYSAKSYFSGALYLMANSFSRTYVFL